MPLSTAPHGNEIARLAALRRYRILDTPAEPEFDRIARLAARLLRTPIALISLVDENRQWFKSHFGLDIRETHRDLSFCAHALDRSETMVVQDAMQDERFSRNSLVVGEPRIRFYAGAPLVTKDGFRLGTLSVIDRVPRDDLGPDDFLTLSHLAALVMDEFELRLATMSLGDYAEKIGELPKAAALIAAAASIDDALALAAESAKTLLRAQAATARLRSGATAAAGVPEGASELWSAEAELTGRTGEKLGALCVQMNGQRRFTAEDKALLRQLAQIASAQIENLLLLNRSRAAEARFRRVVESGMIGIIFWNAAGLVTEANGAFLSMTEYTYEDVLEGRIRCATLLPDVDFVRDLFERPEDGGASPPHETECFRKDGTGIPVLMGAATLRENGSGGGVGFLLDISGRARAEAALRERERIARAIADTALDAFMQMDGLGAVLEWNNRAEEMFGWSRHEVLGMQLADLILPPRKRSAHLAGLQRFLQTGQARILGRRIEVEARRRDGSEFPAELTITDIKLRDGHLFNGFMRDLTEKRSTEAKLRQSQKMEAVGQLTGGISHDFNNVLTVVLGCAVRLAQRLQGKKEEHELASLIVKAAKRAEQLTSQLLAFSRRQVLRPIPTDINRLINGMQDLLRRSLGAEIEVKFVAERQVAKVLVDPAQLESALLNLAINARDAMPESGRLTIETAHASLDPDEAVQEREAHETDYVMIAVSDNGTGMPPDIQAQAFEPFFTTKEAGKGTGLGLSTVYGFVQQSGGRIRVHSEVGQGTTVQLFLPQTQADAEEQSPMRSNADSSTAQRGTETILVVEDDPLVADVVTRQLGELGYRVVLASDGPSALAELASGRHFDLLFTDVMLPGGMGGGEIAARAQSQRPGLRVLFTSGYTAGPISQRGRLDPGVRLLKKPYAHEELAHAIRGALDD